MTSVDDLEARLADLAPMLDAPSGDGVVAAVVTRLRAEPTGPRVVAVALPAARTGLRWPFWRPEGQHQRQRRAESRRVVVIAGAVVAAIVGGAVAGPAVADWLGVRGVEVRRQPPGPPTSATLPRTGASLDLGTAVPSLAAAQDAAGFTAVVPAALGPPDAIWVDRRRAAPFISLVYDGGPLLSQFDATLTDDAVFSKAAGPDTTVERLTIGGEPAVWIDDIHTVAVRARSGDIVFEQLRISDRVLLVQRGRLTIRIEVPNGLGREDAIRIAESLAG